MSFLSPIWLLSIAAVSIPVIIHLWNIRPGRTLKVGSIALIDASSRKRSRSFNLLQLLLLLVRCLLLILAAFVLAIPFFKKKAVNDKSKGWLLISKNNFSEAYQHYKPKADSLIKAGYELHYFTSGFSATTLLQAENDTTSNKTNHDSYWGLAQQLNRQLPSGMSVYIITPNSLNNFIGSKPGTHLKLHWLTYTAKDSTASWIQKAWFTETKAIHLITGESKPSGTVYQSENIKQSGLENSTFALTISNGKAFIGIKNNSQKPVIVDTSTLKIEIFGEDNAADADYVKAALESISQFTQQNLKIGTYNQTSLTKDWLFWLSYKPVDDATLRRYRHILVYEPGKIATISSRIITADGSENEIALYKSVISNNHNSDNEWTDSYGNPILSKELKGTTEIYHFYSHFNPTWNDLVWGARFPQIMLRLIMPITSDPANSATDKRVISEKQIQPSTISEKHIAESNNSSTITLTHYFWLFLVLIFVMERWLAHKNQVER